MKKTKDNWKILKQPENKRQIIIAGVTDLQWTFQKQKQKNTVEYLQYSERRNCQPRNLYLAKILFKNNGGIEAFSHKQKPRVQQNKPTLKEILKDIL